MSRAMEMLEQWGLLLVQDAALPNLAAIVAGERVRGSWWAHPAAKQIFAEYNELVDHRDVTTAKLVSGKVTFVHRRLFGALVAVGRDASARDLDSAQRTLWRKIKRYGKARATGPVAKELERRLLVVGEQVHTAAGNHETVLSTWERFARRHKVPTARRDAGDARIELEQALAAMNAEFGGRGTLPWKN